MVDGCFLPHGKGRTACGGVGDKVIGAVGARKTHYREIVDIELAAVEHPGATYLLQAHSVADHQNYVSDLGIGGRGSDADNLVMIRRGVVL